MLFGDYSEAFLVSIAPIIVSYGTLFISLCNTNQTLYNLLAPFHWTLSCLVHHHILVPGLVPGSEHRFRNCVRILHRNRTNRRCVYLSTYLSISIFLFFSKLIAIHIYLLASGGKERGVFIELAHTIVGAGKFKIFRAGWQVKNPMKSSSCSLDFGGSLQAVALLLLGDLF